MFQNLFASYGVLENVKKGLIIFSYVVVVICLFEFDGVSNMIIHSINPLILITPSMNDIKFLLVVLRYKIFNINIFLKK